MTGPLRHTVRSRNVAALDASVSMDPDGDALTFDWFVYREAGSYRGEVELCDPTSSITPLEAPEVEAPQTVHVTVRVADGGAPALVSCARVVLTMLPRTGGSE